MTLRKTERDAILELLKSGISYEEAAEQLNAQGIKSVRGKDWNAAILSQYAIRQLKFRKRGRYKRSGTKSRTTKASSGASATKLSVDEKLAMDILTSNMSRAHKMQLLKRLI